MLPSHPEIFLSLGIIFGDSMFFICVGFPPDIGYCSGTSESLLGTLVDELYHVSCIMYLCLQLWLLIQDVYCACNSPKDAYHQPFD